MGEAILVGGYGARQNTIARNQRFVEIFIILECVAQKVLLLSEKNLQLLWKLASNSSRSSIFKIHSNYVTIQNYPLPFKFAKKPWAGSVPRGWAGRGLRPDGPGSPAARRLDPLRSRGPRRAACVNSRHSFHSCNCATMTTVNCEHSC